MILKLTKKITENKLIFNLSVHYFSNRTICVYISKNIILSFAIELYLFSRLVIIIFKLICLNYQIASEEKSIENKICKHDI